MMRVVRRERQDRTRKIVSLSLQKFNAARQTVNRRVSMYTTLCVTPPVVLHNSCSNSILG